MSYRLKVKIRGRWKMGIVFYETVAEAQERQSQLKAIGVQSVICNSIGEEV